MQIGVITNTRFGLAAIQSLNLKKAVAGIAAPAVDHDANKNAKFLSDRLELPFQQVEQSGLIEQLQQWINASRPDAVFVFGFPYKIPDSILTTVKGSFWNFHAGKLPQYRGPDPVFWQVRNGESQVVFTVHKMTGEMDAGPILMEQTLPIRPHHPYGMVWSNITNRIPEITEKIYNKLDSEAHSLKPQKDPHGLRIFDNRPRQKDLIINWQTMEADKIRSLVNACNPSYGGAIALFRQGFIQFLKVKHVEEKFSGEPGVVVKADNEGLWIQTKDGCPLSIEFAGMVQGYLTGAELVELDIRPGDRFDSPQ